MIETDNCICEVCGRNRRAGFPLRCDKPEAGRPKPLVNPDDWFPGVILRVHDGYAFATLDNNDQVFISFKLVNQDERGHYCLYRDDAVLVRLEPHSVKLVRRDRQNVNKWTAVECSPQTPRAFSDWERAAVVSWNENGRAGMVHRKCGCRIKVLLRREDEIYFNPGDLVEISDFHPDDRNAGRSIARGIREVEE